MASENDVINRTLGILRAIGSGQSASTEDSAKIQAHIQPKLDELAAREIIYISDSASVPDAALQWVAVLLAQDMADDFGVPMDAGKIQLAEARLRSLEVGRNSADHPKVCYF
jgi:hypothetical protein